MSEVYMVVFKEAYLFPESRYWFQVGLPGDLDSKRVRRGQGGNLELA